MTDFFREAPAGAVVLAVVGSVLWILVGFFRVRAQFLVAKEQAQASPIRRDFGAKQLRMIELAGLAIMVAGLAWYVFA